LVIEYSSKRIFILEFKFGALVHKKNAQTANGTVKERTFTATPKALLPKLLKEAKEQIEKNHYPRNYEKEFGTVHKVAVGIAGRSNVAVEICCSE
jgi:hypothetical protein